MTHTQTSLDTLGQPCGRGQNRAQGPVASAIPQRNQYSVPCSTKDACALGYLPARLCVLRVICLLQATHDSDSDYNPAEGEERSSGAGTLRRKAASKQQVRAGAPRIRPSVVVVRVSPASSLRACQPTGQARVQTQQLHDRDQ